jgi:DNA-binding transcriptional regulator LsrR (DeoR family)
MLDPMTVQDRRALLVRVAELYYVDERDRGAALRMMGDRAARIVGLSPPELMGIRVRVGVAGGAEKAPGVIGAIRAGWINQLVTDAPCAEQIVETVG